MVGAAGGRRRVLPGPPDSRGPPNRGRLDRRRREEAHGSAGRRVVSESFSRRFVGGVRRRAARQHRHLSAARGRTQSDQSHQGLRQERQPARLLAFRRPDRLPLGVRGRRDLSDGRHRREHPPGFGLRVLPVLVARRKRGRGRQRTVRRTVFPIRLQQPLGDSGRQRRETPAARPRLHAAQLVAARQPHRLLGYCVATPASETSSRSEPRAKSRGPRSTSRKMRRSTGARSGRPTDASSISRATGAAA